MELHIWCGAVILLCGIILREDLHWEFYGEQLTAQRFLPTPPHLLHPPDSLTVPKDLMAVGAECSLTVWEKEKRKKEEVKKNLGGEEDIKNWLAVQTCSMLYCACVGRECIDFWLNFFLMFSLLAKFWGNLSFLLSRLMFRCSFTDICLAECATALKLH